MILGLERIIGSLATKQDVEFAVRRIVRAIGRAGLSADDAALLNTTLVRGRYVASRLRNAAKAMVALDAQTNPPDKGTT